MKVIAINGSARKDGNTAILIKRVFAELEREGITTELIQLAGEQVSGCVACFKCFSNKNKRCAISGDCVNDCIAKMEEADGIILGSPTYFADCTAQIKALIDRSGMTARANGDMFKRKVGAAVVSVRRAGAIHAFDSLNHFFTIGQMIIVGSTYWNIGIGRERGEVEQDGEGMKTMESLGQNMAWLLKKMSA
ncbi:MAG TPA: flavodoxin family protein [Candidatus Omnitrophota bacterium]|nr:flavodoxin family protein [Candidatus Omnitrophota bacterium]HPT06934.1 flavodoxin family protein [Candidatus Omnitrophota bacterium]